MNLYEVELERDEEPPGYGSGYRRIGPLVEADEANLNLILLEAGQAVCPYHYEYAEEWLLVLEGEVVVRTPDGEETAVRGDAVCFPAGPDGAHKVWNDSEAPARVVMFSSSRRPAIAVYPDSDKIGVFPPNPRRPRDTAPRGRQARLLGPGNVARRRPRLA